MKKSRVILISVVIFVTIWTGFLIRPQVPSEISGLRIGASVESVQSSLSWIKADAKDHNKTWWSGGRHQHRAGVTYRWSFDITFDEEGRLTKIDGRSYNDVTGILDKTYKLP